MIGLEGLNAFCNFETLRIFDKGILHYLASIYIFHILVLTFEVRLTDLLQPIITPEANPNQDILDVFDKSFLRYLQRGLKAHKVQTTLIGNRGAKRDAYCIVPKHYRESPSIPDEKELADDWVKRIRYYSDD